MKSFKKLGIPGLALAIILALTAIGGSTASAANPSDPIVVSDPSEVPEGAVQTSQVKDDCSTTTTWTLTVPGSEESSHHESRYKRVIPSVEEVSHQEWGIEERTRSSDVVTDYVTQYHFRKFTQTRTQAPAGPDLWWNWSPNNEQGPQDYTPNFGTASNPNIDSRGTWQGPHENGGPNQSTYGTFQTGGGNSPFFHREHGTPAGAWSAYGPWTPWSPETHTSWETSDAPLGSPEFHGSGTYSDGTKWERVWQARFDGQTRQVETGTHVVQGEWTPWSVLQEHLSAEPNLSPDTDVHQYRLVGPVKVIDTQGVEGYTEYYVLNGEPSRDEADASWLLDEQVPAEGWTQFDERTVNNEDGTPEVVTNYVYNDGVKCPPPPKPKPNPKPKHEQPSPTPKQPEVQAPSLPNTGA